MTYFIYSLLTLLQHITHNASLTMTCYLQWAAYSEMPQLLYYLQY